MRRNWKTGAAVGLVLLAVGGAASPAHPPGTDGGGDGGTAGGAGTGTGAPVPDASGRFLPDLVEIMPPRVGIATRFSARRGTRTLLTFETRVENYGTGPLIVRAARPTPGSATMSAWQTVTRSDGRRERVGDVGDLRFVRGGGHSHWHLMGFHRFELRTVAGASLRRDRKTGFCLGDRYDATRGSPMPGEPARARYRAHCGLNDPSRTSLTQGISVGFGDPYPARLEGQFIDITGLPTGRYVLVLRHDPDGRLLELHKHNDVVSMLVKVVRGTRTRARILSWCNFTDSCPTPGLHKPVAR
jgi:hypothetical protein